MINYRITVILPATQMKITMDVKSYRGVTEKHTTCSTKCPNESKKTKNHLIKIPKTNTTSKH
jgi:hypothetical protein